ncbi:MAG: DUF72 domain-containing protein [Bacteriovoracaceae bacterium]|jgi:uncharacterized protein YecE (DUF72 family)|nr:DUF72 domain-containing protein [Bacteriovoracaceae bacterium]
MEFGKTPHFRSVDFSLPKDNYPTPFNYHEDINIYFGTPGWNQREWIGRLYPKGCKPSEFLEHYAKRFNSIELNSTHYALPSKDRIQSWVNMTPDNFRFCPKVLQKISHYGLDKEEFNFFVDVIMQFENKLGLCFLQLPEHFSLNDFYLLEKLLIQKPKDFKLAIEFRNASFFVNNLIQKQVLDKLIKYDINTVITDVAGNRDVLHSTIINDKVIVRFVGNQDPKTDASRLSLWQIRIDSWFKKGLKDLYFFCHQPNNIYSIDLGSDFIQSMNELGANLEDPFDIDLEVQTSLF